MAATCKLPLIFVGLQCPLVRLSPFSSTRQPVRAVLAAFQLPDEDITLNVPTRTSPIYFHTPHASHPSTSRICTFASLPWTILDTISVMPVHAISGCENHH
ncbi:hypothetical protein CTAM01_04541 [Colletotrichum tamarilloi]|uniref:Secreted protein n=1 Tax=Colletotrichum tamarilloi TaxID=1209934 RepID=A0ABQ9RGF7_9PEZI|nr:uncharacterized protein CTAM01_04541 [Colletotrichum tamarilloi]KAK1503229.1 hypothetical protein CTAM01_04541 [Colletotrichum tamarilloi]